MLVCPHCKKEAEDGTKYCFNCGEPLPQEPVYQVVTEQEMPSAKEPVRILLRQIAQKLMIILRAIPKFVWGIIAGVVVLAVAFVTIVLPIMRAGNPDKYVIYVRDGELYLNTMDGREPLELTEAFFGQAYESKYYEVINDAYDMVKMSSDGRWIFYPDKHEGTENSFDLYYRDLGHLTEEGEQIAKNVVNYVVSPGGKRVIYKTEKGLYLYDFRDKEKIEENVQYYAVSEDCRHMIYVTEDGDVYNWQDGESDRLARNANVRYINKDMSNIVYVSEGTLYKMGCDGKETVIAEGVDTTIQCYDNGGIYYLKSFDIITTMEDYVIDQYKESDAAMELPLNPSILESQQWYEKIGRDYLREFIQSYEFTETRLTLYYYDGEETQVVAEDIHEDFYAFGEYLCSDADMEPVMIYHAAVKAETYSIRLEDIQDLNAVYDAISTSLIKEPFFAVARGAQSRILADGLMNSYLIAQDGKTIYYMQDAEDEAGAPLYYATMGEEISEGALYDTGVNNLWKSLQDGRPVYYKEYSYGTEDMGTLYVAKKKIEENVAGYNLKEVNHPTGFYFFKETALDEGTLCYYDGAEVREVSDGVLISDYVCTLEGGLAYLTDWDDDLHGGNLYYTYRGETSQLLDEEVRCFILDRNR